MPFTRRILLGCAFAVAACGDDSTAAPPSVIAMRFASLPSTVTVDTPFSTTVELLGPDGERATFATDAVSLSLIGVGALTGTASVVPAAGVATFTDLRVSSASDALQLKATSAGIAVTSPTFRSTDDCAPVMVTFPVALTGSLGNSACIVDGRPTTYYRFTKPELGPLRFVVTATGGAFVPEITVLNDPPSDFIPVTSAGTIATGDWLLPAAPYRLKVSALSGVAGAFTIGTSTLATAGCVPRTLLPFALVTYPGSVEAGDCFDGGRHYDWFLVHSPRPCTITMHGVSAGFDSFIAVRNARTHQVIAENDNGAAATTDAFVMLTECRAGTDPIEIFSTRPAAGSNGDYALTVQITGGVSTFLIGPGANRR